MHVLTSMAIAAIISTTLASQTIAQSKDTTITITQEEYNVIFTMRTVAQTYMDEIPQQKLSEMAIKGITEQLDPHTRYYGKNCNPDEVKLPRTGLGMECRSYNDTMTVVSVKPYGPAYTAGITPGQKIAYVGKNKVAGKIMSTSDIRKMFDNITTDSASITVFTKKNSEKTLQVAVDTCNNGGISAHYAPNDSTIYIKLSQFNRYTVEEFEKTVKGYSRKKRRNLIIDLRNNPGGMWIASAELCKMFMPKGIRVAKAEGAHYEYPPMYSETDGWLVKSRIYVLINENTASASEVIATCIQDCDRGVIIGRRSYGKGLMQQRITLPSGDMVAITKARLYTPTDRYVQKGYSKITRDAYLREHRQRATNGENVSEKIMLMTIEGAETVPTKFKGREMPCGMGVVPDIFVPQDSTALPDYWKSWLDNGLVEDFMYHYVNIHRAELNNININELDRILNTQDLITQLEKYGQNDPRYGNAPQNLAMYWNGPESPLLITMRNQLHAKFANALVGGNGQRQVLNIIDNDFNEAIKLIANPELYMKALEK